MKIAVVSESHTGSAEVGAGSSLVGGGSKESVSCVVWSVELV